jgi:hypothetical protein
MYRMPSGRRPFLFFLGSEKGPCLQALRPPLSTDANCSSADCQVDDASKSAAKLALHLQKQPDGAAMTPADVTAAPGGVQDPPPPRCALARATSSTPAAAASAGRVAAGGVVSDAPGEGGAGREEAAASAGAGAAADALDSLVQLLEQY